MEAAGLAFGVAGLAGLFTSCLDCFNLVQQGRYMDSEYFILETKFMNQRLRLETWGRACPPQRQKSWIRGRVGSVVAKQQTHSTNLGLQVLSTSSTTSNKTDLVVKSGEGISRRAATMPAMALRSTTFSTKCRWAISDRAKFTVSVQHLRDLNDDLDAITAGMNVPNRQRAFIQEEVGILTDEEELGAIEAARIGQKDPVADAASLRLCQLQGHDDLERLIDVEKVETTDNGDHYVEGGLVDSGDEDDSWEVLAKRSAHGTSSEKMFSQTLYRIRCPDLSDSHSLFFDEPNYVPGNGTKQWLIIDETAIPSKQFIYLVSDSLCEALKSFNLKHKPPMFRPGMELGVPFDWFYHNKYLIKSAEKTLQRPLTRDQAVGQILLDYIREWMGDAYRNMSQLGELPSWEYLPILFRPGCLLQEYPQDGLEELRAVVQTRPGGFTQSPGSCDAIFEIPVARMTTRSDGKPVYTEHRKVQITRSVYDKATETGKLDPTKLPVSSLDPSFPFSDLWLRFLIRRGKKYEELRTGLHVVTYYDSSIENTTGEYLIHQNTWVKGKSTASEAITAPFEGWELLAGTTDLKAPDSSEPQINVEHDPEPTDEDYRLACLPPFIHGFHLRDHVWRKLAVDSIRAVSSSLADIEKIVASEPSMDLLKTLFGNYARKDWSVTGHEPDSQKPMSTIGISVIGAAYREGMEALSYFTKRPLYRVRLCQETTARGVENVYKKAAAACVQWGCIAVLEDWIETYFTFAGASQRLNLLVTPTLRFIEAFKGIVVIPKPTEDALIDPRLVPYFCMEFTFTFRDDTADSREQLWRKGISSRFGSYKFDSAQPDEHILELSQLKIPWESIRSIIDAVVHRERGINWELMKGLAKKQAKDREPKIPAPYPYPPYGQLYGQQQQPPMEHQLLSTDFKAHMSDQIRLNRKTLHAYILFNPVLIKAQGSNGKRSSRINRPSTSGIPSQLAPRQPMNEVDETQNKPCGRHPTQEQSKNHPKNFQRDRSERVFRIYNLA
ncbi:prion-inhibition and propagation-domain-containing protein [Podospora australis]|uniref:Prion-inhibition and propagation-domain-containing protein n=1 Tax=Podospora australis TaxID=1536484 RepID=A0AAN7AHI4_9PEZI|nr:prion-inhibition and propagation-domain-containing protein [Podospora australis]